MLFCLKIIEKIFDLIKYMLYICIMLNKQKLKKMATSKQITKKLIKANISLVGLEISNKEIEISLGYKEENGFGTCNTKQVNKMKKKIKNILPEFNGGYYTGYGSFILQIDYQSIKCDWNDVNSQHHY